VPRTAQTVIRLHPRGVSCEEAIADDLPLPLPLAAVASLPRCGRSGAQ